VLHLEAGRPQAPSVVQNLRLLKGNAVDVWKHAPPKRWSEAAVGVDAQGRVLFLFARKAFTMTEFNARIVKLGAVRAMHMEGGPEASLSLRGTVKLDLCGSYETGFREDDTNTKQWPLPNVLGVRAAP